MKSTKEATHPAGLRLKASELERIDRVIKAMYAGMPAVPSRNAVMSRWILEALERAERPS